MDLATLEITPEQAAERLKEYEAQLAEERTAEDDAIRAGYRAAARGLPVIQLPRVIATGGWFTNGLPRLAVVRANATECFVRVRRRQDSQVNVVFADRDDDRGRARVGAYRVEVSVDAGSAAPRYWESGRTVVPSIPPGVRPRRHRLRGFHILWEVEQWDPTPPVDPALIRHIRGDLWSVVATWDLTELERAVLAGRSTA